MDSPIRKSLRLPGFDYSTRGVYYITIRVKRSLEFLSIVSEGQIILNTYGRIIKETWENTPNVFKEIFLDEYVIMPNHFHGLIFLLEGNCIDHRNNLSMVVKSFKATAKGKINLIKGGINFYWQKSFIDRIIRNESELIRIRNYIKNNPMRWEQKYGKIQIPIKKSLK